MTPQFGTPPTDLAIRERPGSYAVIVDDAWRVAVVVIGTGAFLPGGGAEPGETAEETVRREVREETGLELEIINTLGDAREWVNGVYGPLNRVGRFFVARPTAHGERTESDHELQWWPGSRALAELVLASDKAMVRRALGPC